MDVPITNFLLGRIMVSENLYLLVKSQCQKFRSLGYHVDFQMSTLPNDPSPVITIQSFTPKKIWKFNDPDWGVVSKQLNELYKNINKKG
jgi:hypothetical protein